MEMTVQIPFQQLLTLIKALTPSQKAKLKKELSKDENALNEKDDFIDFLLNGPTYSEADIKIIEENRESISAWRTKA